MLILRKLEWRTEMFCGTASSWNIGKLEVVQFLVSTEYSGVSETYK